MSTPGGDPTGSNPYGGGSEPPPPPPESPYPSYNPYGDAPAAPTGPGTKPPLDGVSIASLVLSLLCCTGLIGVILGFVGLARTKDGRRSGRWAAIAGIVVGLLAMIGGGVVGAIAVWGAGQVVTPDNAEAGQCINTDTEDDTVSMTKRDCTEEHDAEIVAVGEYDDVADHVQDGDLYSSACLEVVDGDDLAAIQEAVGDDLEAWNIVSDDPTDFSEGDAFVCYVDVDSDQKESILD